MGGRFEMDLWGGRASKWTLGVALAGVSSQMLVVTNDGFGDLETIDLRAFFVAARTWRLGENWNVRWSVGLGPMYTDATAHIYDGTEPQMPYIAADGVSMAYETTLTLAREIFDHRWAITAGPAATLVSQELAASTSDGPDISRSDIDIMFMLGARYRL
jgi:hypothetical protein